MSFTTDRCVWLLRMRRRTTTRPARSARSRAATATKAFKAGGRSAAPGNTTTDIKRRRLLRGQGRWDVVCWWVCVVCVCTFVRGVWAEHVEIVQGRLAAGQQLR